MIEALGGLGAGFVLLLALAFLIVFIFVWVFLPFLLLSKLKQIINIQIEIARLLTNKTNEN